VKRIVTARGDDMQESIYFAVDDYSAAKMLASQLEDAGCKAVTVGFPDPTPLIAAARDAHRVMFEAKTGMLSVAADVERVYERLEEALTDIGEQP